MRFDSSEARLIVGIDAALRDGRLNRTQPTIAAREVAAALHGQPSRSEANAMGDLLNKLGVFSRGHGAHSYRRDTAALVDAIDRHRAEAEAVAAAPPLVLALGGD